MDADSRRVATVVMGAFVALTFGVLGAVVVFFVGMMLFASGQDRAGGLAMVVGPLLGFAAGAWYGWRLIRRASREQHEHSE